MNVLRFVFRMVRLVAELSVLGFLFLTGAFLLLYGMFFAEFDAVGLGILVAIIFVALFYVFSRFE